jgi:hypothetical protein
MLISEEFICQSYLSNVDEREDPQLQGIFNKQFKQKVIGEEVSNPHHER